MKEARQDILDAIKIYYKELGFRRDNSRVTHQAQARTALSNVMREHGMKYEEIKAYVNRDHSTIIHAIKAVNDMMDTDQHFYATMQELLKKVKMKAS